MFVNNTRNMPNKGEGKPAKTNTDANFSPLLVCSILTIWAIIGVFIALATKNALFLAFFLLPVVSYEIYRTKGKSTIFSSWAMLVILLFEIIFLIFNISYDLGAYLGLESVYVSGQSIPLGDIKILGPSLLAVFSTILFLRTAGPYTKWLSVIIFISAFVIIFILSPLMFRGLLRTAVQQVLQLL